MAGNHNSGRKPKPTRVKELLGNPGKRRLNHREPQFDPASWAPPERLDEDGKNAWLTYAPALIAGGILTVADALKFELLCKACGRARQLDRAIQASGGVTKDIDPKLLAAEVKYMLLVDKFGSAFGMDPASRTRLKTPEPQKRDWLDALTADEEPTGPGDPIH